MVCADTRRSASAPWARCRSTGSSARAAAVGIDALRQGIGGLWSQIKGMSPSLTGAWSLHGGKVGIAEGSCMYTRQNDTLFTVKTATMFRRRGDKVEDLRIHADLNGLF